MTATDVSVKQWLDWIRSERFMIALLLTVIVAGAIANPVMWNGLIVGIGWFGLLMLGHMALIGIEQWYLTRIDTLVSPGEAAQQVQKKNYGLFFAAQAFSCLYVAFLVIASLIFIVNAIA